MDLLNENRNINDEIINENILNEEIIDEDINVLDFINSHNVSATVSIRKDEWEDVAKWMWENKESYSGLSILPYDGGTYKQAPFIEITRETYNIMLEDFPQYVDFSLIQETFEEADIKHASNNKACAAGGCEI